ncbi:MAG: endo-1,4-beta-xylanase [Bifidobacteriaceae bacterium]|jgi:GH35 family endo-1,4-beta-xylanase|nr:endo-1,4-beta-xylanase [Bifidobacteriaceae bacterium]
MTHVQVKDRSFPHRIGQAAVTVRGAGGAPLAGAQVTVEQTRHAFGFANIGFDFIPLANGENTSENLQRRAELWLDLYNTATLPFYLRGFEPERGKPRTEQLRKTAEWFRDRGVALKGHPLVWHTEAPKWMLGLDQEEVEQLWRQRVRREVSGFAGLIDTWDAINEVVIMPVFEAEENVITPLARAKGRIHMIKLAFEEARAANPNVTLLLNDFDLSTAYECLIEGVLEAGVKIDVLGLQTHMHQGYWGEENMLKTVDRFARYGLPIHMTESSLVSGHLMPAEIVDLNDYQIPSWPSTPEGLERQADEMVRHYKSLLGHPAVQVITYWGVSDAEAWLGAPIGLVFEDNTPKPSYTALHELIKGDWWIQPTTAQTDAEGRFELTGFLGDYRVTGPGGSGAFSLSSSGQAAGLEVTLA